MKKLNVLTRMLLLVALLVGSVSVWATEVTWPGTTALPGTFTNVAGDANIKIKTSSTNTYTNPIRIYANTTVTIQAAEGYKITSVTYTASSTGNYVTYAQNATVSPDVTPTVSNKNVTWSFNTNVSVFTFTPSAQTRSTGITINYESVSNKVSTPTFSPNEGAVASGTDVTISCSTPNSTIYYELTTNGDEPSDPTVESTEYTSAIKITTATKIKAIAVKDGLTNSAIASATYTIAAPCATPTFSVAAGEVDKGTTVELATTTDDATIHYTIDGTDPTSSSPTYSSAITIDEDMTIKAIAVKDGNANSEVASAAYTVRDYATLPFEWEGGSSTSFNGRSGVTTDGLGSDYKDGNAPYLIKLDTNDDYIQIKTNAQPGRVSIGVKMIGGSETSTITVQESADGTNFDEVEELSISGSQNNVLTLLTTKNFKSTTRYLKFVFTKGSNVGVGPIKITGCEAVEVSDKKYATFASNSKLDFSSMEDEGLYAYTAEVSGDKVTFTKVTGSTAAGEGLLLYSATAKTYNVPVATNSPALVPGNKLVRGTGAAVTSAGDNSGEYNYVLSTNNKGEVNFYLANNKEVGTDKAYLKNINPTAVNAKFFLPTGEDETDGIRSIENGRLRVENSNYYNLAGQRVGKDYKGIVIVNGKKMLNK